MTLTITIEQKKFSYAIRMPFPVSSSSFWPVLQYFHILTLFLLFLSLSVSSNDSDEPRHPVYHRHASATGSIASSTDMVDGYYGNKSRPRSSSSVAGGSGVDGRYSTQHSADSSGQRGVFKTPPDVSKMPR